MQMFLGNQLAPDDPRRKVVYRNFQRNLQDILRAGLDSGAKIILNTVAVNLKDCPPFASLANQHLPPPTAARFDQQFAGGTADNRRKVISPRPRSFTRQAAKLDGTVAELQFRWGECLLAAKSCCLRPRPFPTGLR